MHDMVIPVVFTWDEDANGYISEPFTIDGKTLVHIELSRQAPVVTLKMEEDGGFANYGVTPDESDRYEIEITSKEEVTIRLASPVEVNKCYVI